MAAEERNYLGPEATERLIQNTNSTVIKKVTDHNTDTNAHSDIRTAIANKSGVRIITWEEGD